MGVCFGSDADQQNSKITKEMKSSAKRENKVKKLLLLGAGGSGKSTFFKQLRILHGNGIGQDELESTYKEIVYSNVITGMKKLVERATEQAENGNQKCKVKADNEKYAAFIDHFDEDNFAKKKVEVCEAVTKLWHDPAIQEIWTMRAKYQIQDSAEYFFGKVSVITEPGYIPSETDMLYARIRTTGIVEQEFYVKQNKFQIFDVGGQRNERKKWIHCFERVTGVIFLAALSAYDQTLYEDDQTNRMREALDLFKQICNSRWFKDTAMILFLNKKDLFATKIAHTPITVCFKGYTGPSHDEIESREYIKGQFQKLNQPIKTAQGKSKKKQLFIHYTCAIDRDNVQKIFRDVQNVIIHANLEKAALI